LLYRAFFIRPLQLPKPQSHHDRQKHHGKEAYLPIELQLKGIVC
jgi:hypothetical protein